MYIHDVCTLYAGGCLRSISSVPLWYLYERHTPEQQVCILNTTHKRQILEDRIEFELFPRPCGLEVGVSVTCIHGSGEGNDSSHEKRIDPKVRGSMRVRILEILFDDLAAEPQGQGECMNDILLSSKSASSTQHTRGKYWKTGLSSNFFPSPVA